MRDAFGGAFMIRLFLIFIFIYMFFTAIALNYAKAFKVKNRIIEYLQDNEVYTIKDMNAKEFETYTKDVEELLGSLNYRIPREEMHCGEEAVYCDNGIEIKEHRIESKSTGKLGVYYTVTTKFAWSLPFLEKITALGGNTGAGDTPTGIWNISGQTRTIIKK